MNQDFNYKRPWYLSTWFIFLMAASWIGILPAIVLARKQQVFDSNINNMIQEYANGVIENARREAESVNSMNQQQANQIIENARREAAKLSKAMENSRLNEAGAQEKLNKLIAEIEKLEKRKESLSKKVSNLQVAQKSIDHSVKYYRANGEYKEFDRNALDLVYPTVILPTHSMDVKSLRSKATNIKKQIEKLLLQYNDRYTTKANKSIYSLMTIALQAELQNILQSLKYDRLDVAKDNIKSISDKYIGLAGEGNKSIYNTIVQFIGEIESHFTDLVETEYEYYVKREREKEEQRLLREQMRQEAEERKQLEAERKKIEAEEAKFTTEMDSINDMLSNEQDNEKVRQLEERLRLLQEQLDKVEEKKEEIVNLQNGKAGYVYIISNVGSFGEDVFKVGMTRRIEPMDRVKELSGASVPFSFDVHSFIFSENAPKLESELHNMLDDHRVNKVNPRKEFFKVSVDHLENLTSEIDPTAEFKKTILAQEYEQSIALSAS